MHEFSLSTSLVEAACDLARRHRAAQVTELRCHVGAYTRVVPELLEQAFAITAAGTLVAEARLVLEIEPFRLKCRACGQVAECRAGETACGACGSEDVTLMGDHGLTILSMTMEAPDED